MEILPGVGVELAKIGDRRTEVEKRLGSPVHPGEHARAVYDAVEPHLVVTYDRDGLVELIETGYSVDDGKQVFLDGVRLTYRFMDDVVADLAAKGHRAVPTDIGFVFPAGFGIFSMSSLGAPDLDPDATEDDEREIVEGVAVAPYAYLTFGPPPDASPEQLETWLREQGVLPPG